MDRTTQPRYEPQWVDGFGRAHPSHQSHLGDKSRHEGYQRFGAPPPPNGLFIKIMGLCLPVVGIIGIVAAIALPAYQGYVQRAKASQVVKP